MPVRKKLNTPFLCYEGRFQVKELQYEDTPLILDRRDDFG
jgi:hypothetical protein